MERPRGQAATICKHVRTQKIDAAHLHRTEIASMKDRCWKGRCDDLLSTVPRLARPPLSQECMFLSSGTTGDEANMLQISEYPLVRQVLMHS